MKPIYLFGFLTAVLCTVSADDKSPNITRHSLGSTLEWDGQSQRTYFIKWSTDLSSWEYIPVIRKGAGNVMTQSFNTNAEKFFLRLNWTDQSYSGDGSDVDFDNDGISAMYELKDLNANPVDTHAHGSRDLDGDGLTDLEEYHLGTNPKEQDTDGDGIIDSEDTLPLEAGSTQPSSSFSLLTRTEI